MDDVEARIKKLQFRTNKKLRLFRTDLPIPAKILFKYLIPKNLLEILIQISSLNLALVFF